MDISEEEVMLRTWSKIDIPPNPSKKAHIVIFIVIFLTGIFEMIDTPFVSSTIPEKIPAIKFSEIPKNLNNGANILDKISNAPAFSSIEIITLKSITKPPIIIIVFTDVIILFCKILPKEFNLGGVFILVLDEVWNL